MFQSGSALEKTEEQKERRVSKDDEDKEKKRKERRGKRYSMDKTFLSSASHIVISLTDKRDKEIVNVIHSDIAEEKVDPAVENAEYENYKLTPESQNQLKTTFHYFSSETCQAFGKILEIVNSREVNAQLLPPEFVLIGPTGHGKSSILEALLGHLFNLNTLSPFVLSSLSFSISTNSLFCSFFLPFYCSFVPKVKCSFLLDGESQNDH